MRVMLVGTGAIAYRHAAACRDLEGAELVAVCDVRREGADALADQFEVESRYTELDVMLASEQADPAIIATWGVYHAEIVEKLAKSGKVKAILCEKPRAIDTAQAEAMAKIAADHGVLLAEAFRLRHQPIHHRAIEIIRSGQTGEVRHVRNAVSGARVVRRRAVRRPWRG